MSNRQNKAKDLFVQGYTCSQAVLMAFSEVTGLEDSVAAKIASGFGGGIGGLRNLCGAVIGMVMVANVLYGFDSAPENGPKTQHYQAIRTLTQAFEQRNSTLLCKELLAHLPGKLSQDPGVRDEAYYKTRPCALYVEDAVGILEQYMKDHPVGEGQ